MESLLWDSESDEILDLQGWSEATSRKGAEVETLGLLRGLQMHGLAGALARKQEPWEMTQEVGGLLETDPGNWAWPVITDRKTQIVSDEGNNRCEM